MSELTIENVVGSGMIEAEFDLFKMANEFSVKSKRYEPEAHPALYLRLNEGGPLVTLYRTGSFHIAGAKSIQDSFDAYKDFIDYLFEEGAITKETPHEYEVKNIVGVGTYDDPINLHELSIILGLENSEYEPEQFPGLIYRSKTATFNIFSSGKIVVAGCRTVDQIESSFDELVQEIEGSVGH